MATLDAFSLPYTLTNDPISRRHGTEPVNYFSVSPLNRVSFLRQDHAWLATAFAHPGARFLPFQKLGVLTRSSSELLYLPWQDIEDLSDDGSARSMAALLFNHDKAEQTRSTALATIETQPPQVVFLGLDPRQDNLDNNMADPIHTVWQGRPLFAIDLSPRVGAPLFTAAVEKLTRHWTDQGFKFLADRLNLSFNPQDAGVYAQGRHILDWHARNPFCAACGSQSVSTNGGWKRVCTSDTRSDGAIVCPTKDTPRTISNLTFPRTDAAIIVAVLSPSGTHVLLGRQARWPKGRYSTLAGFLEPGESVEDAVRREVLEESGVVVGRVMLWGSQPWPFPANIMLGAIAVAVEGNDKIDVTIDKELEDAQWVPLGVVKGLLADTSGWTDVENANGSQLSIPPRTAIAHQLLETVCNEYAAVSTHPKVVLSDDRQAAMAS